MENNVPPFFVILLFKASLVSCSDGTACIGKSTSSLDHFLACAENPFGNSCWSPETCSNARDGCFSYMKRDSLFDSVNFTAGCMPYDDCVEAKSSTSNCKLATVLANIILPFFSFECMSCCNDGSMCNNFFGIDSTFFDVECETTEKSQPENVTAVNPNIENTTSTSNTYFNVSVTEYSLTKVSYADMGNITVANTTDFSDLDSGVSNVTDPPERVNSVNVTTVTKSILSSNITLLTMENKSIASENLTVANTTFVSDLASGVSNMTTQRETVSSINLTADSEGILSSSITWFSTPNNLNASENLTAANTTFVSDLASGVSNMTTQRETVHSINLTSDSEGILSSSITWYSTPNNLNASENIIVGNTTDVWDLVSGVSNVTTQHQNSSFVNLTTDAEEILSNNNSLPTTENKAITKVNKTVSGSIVTSTAGSRFLTAQTYINGTSPTGSDLNQTKQEYLTTGSIDTTERLSSNVVSPDRTNSFSTKASTVLQYGSKDETFVKFPHLCLWKRERKRSVIVGQGVSFSFERSLGHTTSTFKCSERN